MFLLPIAALASLALAGQPAAAPTTAPATQPAEAGFALTVYSTADPAFNWMQWEQNRRSGGYYYGGGGGGNAFPGYGVVRETRTIALDEGRNAVRFTGVAACIDPTTLRFRDLLDPTASVQEQSYEYDLLDAQRLLEKHVGKTLKMQDGRTVELLSVSNGGIVYRQEDGGPVRIMPGGNAGNLLAQIDFPNTAGMILQPTLVWDVLTARGGERPVQVTYETTGLTWRADYTVVTNPDDTAVDVGAWVTLVNQSGLSYPETRLKLVAGDVQRVNPPGEVDYPRERRAMAGQMAQAMPAGFEEKSFFEYHLYTLGRPTSLGDNSTKQIELFPTVERVPVDKVYVYYGLPDNIRHYFGPSPATDRERGTQSNKKIDVYLRFKNAEANALGIPLPAGKMRVYKRDDADDTLEFIGEDIIQHTPREENVLVRLGSAFDLVGERIQTGFRVDANARWMEEDIEIKLRNRKREPATIIVKENLYRWVNWEILKKSHDFEKPDARTIHFPVALEPDEEATVTYTVRYAW